MKTPVKKRGFGMKSIKDRIILILSCITSFILGVIVQDIPFITFDSKIDLSTLISIASLVATIFIMPFIIESRIASFNNIKTMLVVDLDDICETIKDVRSLYDDNLSIRSIKENHYILIVSKFKKIGSSLSMLSEEFSNYSILTKFKEEIVNGDYMETYRKCTENLKNGKRLSTEEIRESQRTLDMLSTKIKQCRYRLYK